MATKKTNSTKTAKRTTTKKAAKKTQPSTAVKTFIRRIGTYINPETGTWKKRWNAETVAARFGLTKMQVAAVLAHYNMGTYRNPNQAA